MLCRGLQVPYLSIDDESELSDAIGKAREALKHGPVVIEVRFDNSQRTYFTEGVLRTNFARLPWTDRIRFAARALGRRIEIP